MWNTKRPETQQAVAPESKGLLTSAETVNPLDSAGERETGWLGSNLWIKGDITGTADLEIDGSVEGRIQLDERKLTVGTTAKLTADISARDVVVYGYVKGNISAKGRIEIRKDGSVIGNLITAQIMIEDGANFKGSIEIDRGTLKEDGKNISSRAASAGVGRS
jgi:cytoskeletal protein CcmA (bactofilin family)